MGRKDACEQGGGRENMFLCISPSIKTSNKASLPHSISTLPTHIHIHIGTHVCVHTHTHMHTSHALTAMYACTHTHKCMHTQSYFNHLYYKERKF